MKPHTSWIFCHYLAALSLLLLLPLYLQQTAAQVTTSAAAARSRNRCPPERERQMQVCAQRMTFLGDHSFQAPKNLTSVGPFCSDLNKSVTCIQVYARECLTGFTRQLLGQLMKRGKQQHSLICSGNAARLDFISKMSCLSEGERIGQFHRLMDASITRFEYVASRQVKVDSRLQAICCSYQIFFRDLEQTLNRICGKPVERKGSSNEFVEKIVGGTAGEFFGVICEGHRTLDECKTSKVTAELVPKLEQITSQVYAGQLAPKGKSLIPVLLEILDSTAVAS